LALLADANEVKIRCLFATPEVEKKRLLSILNSQTTFSDHMPF